MTYEQAKEIINTHGNRWAEHVADKPQPAPLIARPINRISTMRRMPLSNDDLKRTVPSVFALEPWQEMSDQYRFIPTINVIEELRGAGFFPMTARQSTSRIPGKKEFTKHVIRFRRLSELPLNVGDIIPEIGLVNSHDGTSCYKFFLGLFRCICSNQAVVANADLYAVKFSHRGGRDLCKEVIDISGRVIDDAPKTLEKVEQWKRIQLPAPERVAFAETALSIYDSAIQITPERILRPRRNADTGTDLWTTFNVVQENMMKGGIVGRNSKNHSMTTREIKAVDRDLRVNRALWMLAEKMESIKGKN